jgi:hypothetical protein
MDNGSFVPTHSVKVNCRAGIQNFIMIFSGAKWKFQVVGNWRINILIILGKLGIELHFLLLSIKAKEYCLNLNPLV